MDMNTMRWHSRALLSFLIAIGITHTTGFAANAFETGDDWLNWGNDTRLAYVSGYVRGQGRGFRDGCVAGQEVYSPKSSGLPGEKCIAKIPTYSKPLETYAARVTEYYSSYPTDRNVPIFRILEGLADARGLTLQQMHEYFPASVRKKD